MINVKTKLLYSFSPRIKPVINGIIAIAKFIIKQIKVFKLCLTACVMLIHFKLWNRKLIKNPNNEFSMSVINWSNALKEIIKKLFIPKSAGNKILETITKGRYKTIENIIFDSAIVLKGMGRLLTM